LKTTAQDILNIYFERKKLSFPNYSLRALARDLNVSAPYISNILNGKKPVPENRLADFIKVLDLDDIAILQLKNAVFPETKKATSEVGPRLNEDDIDFINKYRPLDKKKYEVLNDWYNVAILDLTTCEGFQSDPAWIAKKLKLNQLQVEIAIENLKRHDLLKSIDGKLEKVEDKLRFPTNVSQAVIRKFHKQMIKKAYEELDQKVEDGEFANRLIAGTTFALNPDKINLLKEKIQNTIYEVANTASEGPCQSVYQLNFQFFPLSK
jgi:uncharacterized protein (TIGR02147 family)